MKKYKPPKPKVFFQDHIARKRAKSMFLKILRDYHELDDYGFEIEMKTFFRGIAKIDSAQIQNIRYNIISKFCTRVSAYQKNLLNEWLENNLQQVPYFDLDRWIKWLELFKELERVTDYINSNEWQIEEKVVFEQHIDFEKVPNDGSQWKKFREVVQKVVLETGYVIHKVMLEYDDKNGIAQKKDVFNRYYNSSFKYDFDTYGTKLKSCTIYYK